MSWQSRIFNEVFAGAVASLLLMITLAATPVLALLAAVSAPDSSIVIRVNQVGYLPDAPKVAVACALDSTRVTRVTRTFVVRDERGRTVFGPHKILPTGAFGPCQRTWRLDFSELSREGRYRVAAFGVTSRTLRIDAHAYDGGADTLLNYMREQRSGWNPVIGDSVHTHDGIVVDDSTHINKFVSVSGGWGTRRTTCSTSPRRRTRRTCCSSPIAIMVACSATNSTRAAQLARTASPTSSTKRATA